MNKWPHEHDRSLINTLVERLQREAVHVALIGQDTHALDDLGLKLVQSLRQDAGLEVVVFFDAQDEILIGRINQRLALLSMEQARQARSASQPLQVWVMQIQTDEQCRQAQLMGRMVRDFPAVNIRLILLVSASLAPALLEGSVGRIFLPWWLPDNDAVSTPKGADPLPEDEQPQGQAEPALPVRFLPKGRAWLVSALRARLRYPPHPGVVAAIAITLLLVSILVRYALGN
jgi:hypothetical protein